MTGWKSIFALGPFPKAINELHADESDELLKKLLSVIPSSHDLQVRLKWKNENDLAIWDNRNVFHTATFDYDGLVDGERFGHRAVGIGERFVYPLRVCAGCCADVAVGHSLMSTVNLGARRWLRKLGRRPGWLQGRRKVRWRDRLAWGWKWLGYDTIEIANCVLPEWRYLYPPP